MLAEEILLGLPINAGTFNPERTLSVAAFTICFLVSGNVVITSFSTKYQIFQQEQTLEDTPESPEEIPEPQSPSKNFRLLVAGRLTPEDLVQNIAKVIDGYSHPSSFSYDEATSLDDILDNARQLVNDAQKAQQVLE